MWTEATRRPAGQLMHFHVTKRSKYGAVKTTVDGIVFDSKREAQRYHELKLREKAGEIRSLKCQVRYSLSARAIEAPVSMIVGDYIADFTYEERGKNPNNYPDVWPLIVEDVKGVRTPLYRWKAKHMKIQYGIQIREV